MKVTSLFGLVLATFVFSASSHAATIPTVPVGNPGNAGDVQSRVLTAPSATTTASASMK